MRLATNIDLSESKSLVSRISVRSQITTRQQRYVLSKNNSRFFKKKKKKKNIDSSELLPYYLNTNLEKVGP